MLNERQFERHRCVVPLQCRVLVVLGFLMIGVFMTLIMTKRLTPVVALFLVPTVFGLFAGAGLGMGDMVIDAVEDLAPTAALLMFAIIYFGMMIDVGLFDPIVRGILRMAGDDPAKVVVGTAVLAAVVSLDGDGSTTGASSRIACRTWRGACAVGGSAPHSYSSWNRSSCALSSP